VSGPLTLRLLLGVFSRLVDRQTGCRFVVDSGSTALRISNRREASLYVAIFLHEMQSTRPVTVNWHPSHAVF
jgi:hypothetical protein